MRPSLRLAALIAACSVATTVASLATQEKPPDQVTRIRIDQTAAAPDTQATVSVYLTAAPAARIGALEIALTFPAALLTFTGVEPSGLAEGVEARTTAEAQPSVKDPKETTLRVKVSTIEEGGSRAPLPDGPLVHLMLKIAKTAPEDTIIPLVTKAEARTTDTPPQPVTPLAVSDGQVIVAKGSVFSCFFYMH